MAKTVDTRKIDAWAKLRQIATADPRLERLSAILEARDAGWTYAQIGSALGVTAQAVHAFVGHTTTRRTNRGENTQ